ncbi:MAG: sodium/proline symporter PutP [Treponema sp.]|nr:sodium/proline symporter PutP [Treponema sp.]
MFSEIVLRLIAFVLYLGVMIAIGLQYVKRNASAGDFFLGGRNAGPWFTALSAEASDMSGWLLMGLPGVAYVTGMKSAFWTAVGLVIGTYLNWLLIARRLRRYSAQCGNAITIPEFLTNRFKDHSYVISRIAVVFILIFFTIYTASGFVACAQLINSVYGLPYRTGLILGAAVIVLYTLLGGYLAVCATDFIQGTLMFIALITTLIIMMVSLGGLSNAVAQVNAFGAQFLNPFVSDETDFGIMNIVSSLGWGLGYFGMPHILVRFMAISDDKQVPLSRRIAMVWVTLSLVCAVIIGVFAKVYLHPALAQGAQETVIIETLKRMYPAFIGGVFLCAILAAAMSTADSQLLVAASALSEDFIGTILKKRPSDRQLLNISRLTVLGIAVIAFVVALDEHRSIFGLVSYAWAGFGATFGPLILLSLFWRGGTAKGAIAGIIAGGVVVIVWHQLSGGIFDIYEIIPGFAACLVCAVIVSALDRHKDAAMLAEFDAYREMI